MSDENDEDGTCICLLASQFVAPYLMAMYTQGAVNEDENAKVLGECIAEVSVTEGNVSADEFDGKMALIVAATLTDWLLSGQSICDIMEKALKEELPKHVVVDAEKIVNGKC